MPVPSAATATPTPTSHATAAPRFSILLPTHNRADVLPLAIRSALAQTEGDFELLIAGDGCTDRTAEVVRGFDDPRIRWFDLPKAPGIGYASRNAALRTARGTYIAYLAHDDLWLPDHLARIRRAFEGDEDGGVEFVYSRLLAMDVDGRLRPSWYNLEIRRHADGLWRGDAAITMASVAHRRACLDRYGFWDETLHHGADFALWHRILVHAGLERIRFLPEPTAIHFVADWRRTRRYAARMRLVDWWFRHWFDELLPPALRVQVGADETQQAAMWRLISAAPARQTAAIRKGVIQFQDALLWRARTTAGLFALRAGLSAGTALEALWRPLAHLCAPKVRQRYARLRAHTRGLEARRR